MSWLDDVVDFVVAPFKVVNELIDTSIDIVTDSFKWVAGAVVDIPKIPSSTYGGDSPYITVNNGKVMAEAYGGPFAIAGNLLRSNDPASDATWAKLVLGHCQGPIEEYLATFVNGKEFSQLAGTHYMVHGYGDSSQEPLRISGTDLFDDKYCAFKGLAHSAYKFNKNSKHIGSSTPSIVEIIKGRKLIPISTNGLEGDNAWSRSIANVLWDYYRRYDKPSIIKNGLIAHYAAKAESGSSDVDSSDYKNHGTITGATWEASGRDGYCLRMCRSAGDS